MSGTRDGRDWPPRGSTVDLPDDEALVLLRGSMAVPAGMDVPETAVPLTTDVVTAVVPTSKLRPGRK
jgi:hypothetical protein